MENCLVMKDCLAHDHDETLSIQDIWAHEKIRYLDTDTQYHFYPSPERAEWSDRDAGTVKLIWMRLSSVLDRDVTAELLPEGMNQACSIHRSLPYPRDIRLEALFLQQMQGTCRSRFAGVYSVMQAPPCREVGVYYKSSATNRGIII